MSRARRAPAPLTLALLLLVPLALVLGARWQPAAAQSTARVEPEVRADLIVGHQAAVQLGGGVQIPVGTYVRVGVDGALGVGVNRDAGSSTPLRSGRVDLLARFLLDPFRQTGYGLSVGGGLSVRAEQGDRVRPWLLVAAEVEGRRWRSGWVPALQVGLGGGARVGVVVRRAGAGVR